MSLPFLYGCEESEHVPKTDNNGYLEGIVIDEYISGNNILSYAIKAKTNEGIYTFAVSEYEKPISALALAIEKGDKIKFKMSGVDNTYRFFNDKVGGSILSKYITILEKGNYSGPVEEK